jgi:hypothetical protein
LWFEVQVLSSILSTTKQTSNKNHKSFSHFSKKQSNYTIIMVYLQLLPYWAVDRFGEYTHKHTERNSVTLWKHTRDLVALEWIT